MAASPALWAYLAFSNRGAGVGRRLLRKRLAEGKEDPDRLAEREGVAGQARPDGPLIWFHAASVGESLSLLEVIRRLGDHDADLSFLITTGTVTSAAMLKARMPPRCIHQYVPLDVARFVTSFLDHWRPDLAIWTESELWPSLILQTNDRGVPLLLLNARMSDRSVKRWRRLGNAMTRVMGCFRAVQAQDDRSAAALRKMGVSDDRLVVTGTLKEGMPPPPCDEPTRAEFARAIGDRPVWAATSTHDGEEAIVAAAQAQTARTILRLLLILVPRHPQRADAIAADLREAGLSVARRSAGEHPGSDTSVYLADSIGEMGLWYRLAPVSFVGGSLVKTGGHNPFEPAALGSAILHGPHVANFADIYAKLDAADAARMVHDADTLSAAVMDLMQPAIRAPMAYAAWELGSSGADATDKAISVILDHLPATAA